MAPLSVLAHVVDVHCHPTDSPITADMMDELPIRVCAMSTRPSDQALVRDLAQRYPDKVVPAFGYHPWFSHWISTSTEPEGTQISKEAHYRSLLLSQSSSPEHRAAFDRLLPYLPDPTPLHDILTSLRADLLAFPHAMLGEVGLDRSARIPYTTPSLPPYTLHEPAHGTRKDVLSPFTIPIDHQVKVLEVQLEVAVELGRNVSVHSVKAQLATVELLERMKGRFGSQWADVSVDLHSCGLSAETWKDIERKHRNVFLSLSTVINSRSSAHKVLIDACGSLRILVESDYNDIRRCAPQTWNMVQTVAEVRGWEVEETWEEKVPEDRKSWGVVRRLEDNWERFRRGGHSSGRNRHGET